MSHIIPALGDTSIKSCDTCKWLRKSPDQTTIPNVCGAIHSKPVDLTLMTLDQVAASHRMIGGSCAVYNKSQSEVDGATGNVTVAFPIHDPDPERINEYMRNQCRSCHDCEHYIPPTLVQEKGMAYRGMCAAKGWLLDESAVSQTAKECNVRRKGVHVDSTEFNLITWVPEYTLSEIDRFMRENDSNANRTCLPVGYDPTTHETDAPVTEEHIKMGIRAWVNVYDPEGTGNFVALPIFRPDYFDDFERSKIPQSTDEERPDMYVDFAGIVYDTATAWQMLDETPAYWGPPGVGKTELGRHMAWIMQLPFERISITGTTELDDLQGSMRFENNETVFHPGRVTRAWQKPNVCLIDEPNVGPREVWQFFRPLTDNSKQLVVDADRGEPLRRDQNCFLMFAMNPAWDIRNEGANSLADADIRRLFHIEMGLPTPEVERKIIKDHCALDGFEIPEKLLDLLMSIASGIRAQAEENSLPITWGIGSQIKVARYLNWFQPIVAYRRAAGDSLEPDIREIILNEVRTKTGVL